MNIINQKIKRGNKVVGHLTAIKHEDTVGIGWALCNKKDEYSSDFAKFLACERALKHLCSKRFVISNIDSFVPSHDLVAIPESISENVFQFVHRAKKYFKETSVAPWSNEYVNSLDKVYNSNLPTRKSIREYNKD